MKRFIFTISILILILPKLVAAAIGGPFEIYVDLIDPTGNEISIVDLSTIDVNINKGGTSILATYINETESSFTDFHFDVGPRPDATLGDRIWEDASSSDFTGGDSFFDIFFEITLDNRLIVDMFKGEGLGVPIGKSFQVSLVNNTDFDLTASSYPTVPEPTSLALFGLGLAGIVYRRKKQHNFNCNIKNTPL